IRSQSSSDPMDNERRQARSLAAVPEVMVRKASLCRRTLAAEPIACRPFLSAHPAQRSLDNPPFVLTAKAVTACANSEGVRHLCAAVNLNVIHLPSNVFVWRSLILAARRSAASGRG